MSPMQKKSHHSSKSHVIKQTGKGANRSPALRGRPVKKKQKHSKKSVAKIKQIEQEYLQLFTPHPLPHHGMDWDKDSLEQPSEFTYVPTTTAPAV